MIKANWQDPSGEMQGTVNSAALQASYIDTAPGWPVHCDNVAGLWHHDFNMMAT